MAASTRDPRPGSGPFAWLALAMLAVSGAVAYGQPAASGRKDVFFLIDVTGSMVGEPRGSGNPNILGRILKRVVEHVEFDCAEGDRLFVATFQDRLHDLDGPGAAFDAVREFRMRKDFDAAKAYVLAIEAGVHDDKKPVPLTGIFDSLDETFGRMRRAGDEAGHDPAYSQRLVLFTDGDENVKPAKLPEILDHYRLLREESSMGDRVFWLTLVYGQKVKTLPEGPGMESRHSDPDTALQSTVQVTSPALDLGNLYGLKRVAVPIELEPRNTRLQRVQVRLASVAGSLPAGVLAVEPEARIANGRAELVFTLRGTEAADAALIQARQALELSGRVELTSLDERYRLSPSTLELVGQYNGSRDVTAVVRFRKDSLAWRREDSGLARFRPDAQAVPLLETRFSSLASKDSLKATLQRSVGLEPPQPVALSTGTAGRSGAELSLLAQDRGVFLALPAVACMTNGQLKYELRLEVPEGVALRLQSSDGQALPLAADGRSALVTLPIVAKDYPQQCPTPFCPSIACTLTWALGILGLAGLGVLGWFTVNRPPRSTRLESQGIVPNRLRRAQGFFSDWVEVGPRGKLAHSGLTAPAFRIRSTTFGGTQVVPLTRDLLVEGREVQVGKLLKLGRRATFTVRSEGRPDVDIRLVS